ncbi:MAG TPA: hypothetical protein VHW43_06740, partial [Puia sp.]|nr:hypothetical protein [Puia sp.]
GLMGELSGGYREIWEAARGIPGILPGDPKVSRGENYRGLPWVMLDYPRVFGRADVLAIRTFFLWGHGFNVTLHLKGAYQSLYLPVIRSRREELAAAGFHVGVSDDEWRHEHTAEVFRPFAGDVVAAGDVSSGGDDAAAVGDVGSRGGDDAAASGGDAGFGDGEFFKLSAAVGLDRWGEAPDLLMKFFDLLVGVLKMA